MNPDATCSRILAGCKAPQVTSPTPPAGFNGVQLSGSITALATPFTGAGAVDLDAYRRLIERQLAAGSAGLVVAGSTGEAAALEADEYRDLLSAAVGVVAGRVPVLAGSGLSSTAKTVAQTRLAGQCGADAALVVTPPYVRPTQAGLVAHYRAVAADGGLPVVLYNVPGRTGVDLLPETVAMLAGVAGIVGVKEAHTGVERMTALVALRRPGFAVLSGDDPTARRAIAAGADGVISVASNLVPGAFRRLCALAAAAPGQAAALDAELADLYTLLAAEPNPIPLKALLALATGIADVLRLPLLPLSAGLRGQADAVWQRAARIEAASGAAVNAEPANSKNSEE
jgi:4-hydroxy-tetrahydrodipicolinate synthase